MDSALFKSYIIRNHDTQKLLAEALGISLSNLNAKINGKTASFRQSEIMLIKDRYHLSAEEVDAIFFAVKCLKKTI